MIQYRKFHFLILFRKIIIHTFFFNYIVLSFIESWHSTQTDTIHKRRHNPRGEFLSVTTKQAIKTSEKFWFFFPFICTYIYIHTLHIHTRIDGTKNMMPILFKFGVYDARRHYGRERHEAQMKLSGVNCHKCQKYKNILLLEIIRTLLQRNWICVLSSPWYIFTSCSSPINVAIKFE